MAPDDGDGPDFGTLKVAFETCVSDLQPFVDQCRQNYETRYALWPGQSADGKKHSREGNGKIDPTPWDGASDLRVFLVDEAINSKVALMCMAARKAQITATPTEGNDLKRAKVVTNFMRWLVETQVPEIERETELLAQYLNEKGIAATGQFWEVTQQKTLVTITLDQLQEKFPQYDAKLLIQDDMMDETFTMSFEQAFGCSPGKAKKMLKELRKTGETSVATLGKEKSRPIVRAFDLGKDLFIPDYSTDLEKAPAVYRVEYFTPETLRSMAFSCGWDSAWVEAAIKKCKGRCLTIDPATNSLPQSRSFNYIEPKKYKDLIGVVYAYQRLSDEDGVPGIYNTIFNPDLPPDDDQKGYAKTGLLGYAHGSYPFVLHRREYLSRRLYDTRGIPEPGKPLQDQIKAHKDGMIDAGSIAIIPPLGYPIGRPPLKWGPGARIPERRQGEYHFMDRPMPDLNTQESVANLQADFARYNGFISPETDPTFSTVKNQIDVQKFLSGWEKAYNQIWHLYSQYGSDQVYFRVVGLKQEDPTLFEKGGGDEEYDFRLTFDVQSMDWQVIEKKFEAMAKILQTFDKYGQADYSELMQIAVEAIDPNWAERIIQPQSVGAQKAAKDMKDTIAKASAGFDEDIQLGTPPQIGQQVMQQYVQAPDVQFRLQTDEAFKGRIEKLSKQLQFQITQQKNAQIGKLGA